MMKKWITLFLVCVNVVLFGQNYHFGDLTLTKQLEIDTFNIQIVRGTLTIKGNQINNLNGLSTLQETYGLVIDSTSVITLNGLQNLKFKCGSCSYNAYLPQLQLSNNTNLNNLSGFGDIFSNIDYSGFIINIKRNQNLTTLNGLLNNVKNMPTNYSIDVYIDSNQNLLNVKGVDNDTSLGKKIKFNWLVFSNNNKLVDISSLKNYSVYAVDAFNNKALKRIEFLKPKTSSYDFYYLRIYNNDSLRVINLSNVEIRGLEVNNNLLLDSLLCSTGFKGIGSIYTIDYFRIENNPKLKFISNLITNIPLLLNNNASITDLDFLTNYNYPNGGFEITNNLSLTDCCILDELVNSNKISDYYVSGNSFPCDDKINIQNSCNGIVSLNIIIGHVYKDVNTNNKPDAGDIFIDNIKLQTVKNGNLLTHLSADTGRYYFESDTGAYTIQPLSDFANFATVPTSQTISHTTYGNRDTINFKLAPTALVNDASVVLINNGITRPNRPTNYTISYTNESGQNYNGTIKLKLDNRLTYQNATPSPTTIVGDTMIWNITNMPLFTTKNITINFLPLATLVTNDILNSFAKIYNAQTDVTPSNNQYTLTDIVRTSYDPNNKGVDKTILSSTEVAQSPYLYYTIHFQNVGNDTAFNITINDTLDANLDWTTFQPITASHNYQLTQTNNRYIQFDFLNIKLPDSTRNEIASHGFITYKIKTKNNLVVGNSILNKVSIVFDVNTPIVTNTTNTVIMQTYAGRDTTICAGQSVTLTATGATTYSWSNGQTTQSITVSPTVTTTYIVTGMVNGISQKDTVMIFVNPTKTTNITRSICAGSSYTFNGQTLITAGTYRDTLQQANSCDSFIVLTLQVNPTKTTNITQAIQQGQTYNFNGQILNAAGTYYDTLQQTNSCDSIIVLELSVITATKNNISFVDNINVFPNPTNELLTVQLNAKKSTDFNVSLITIDGRILTTKKYTSTSIINDVIDMKNYSNGIYFLQVVAENEKAMYKLIKQ